MEILHETCEGIVVYVRSCCVGSLCCRRYGLRDNAGLTRTPSFKPPYWNKEQCQLIALHLV